MNPTHRIKLPVTTVRIGHLLDAYGRQFAQCNHGQFSPSENESHAAELCHALNHRDKLVNALEDVLGIMSLWVRHGAMTEHEIGIAEQARQALADTEGKV